jgi:hypothetical protein
MGLEKKQFRHLNALYAYEISILNHINNERSFLILFSHLKCYDT